MRAEAISAGADLSYANLRNANCKLTDFEAAHPDGANFDNADMEGVQVLIIMISNLQKGDD